MELEYSAYDLKKEMELIAESISPHAEAKGLKILLEVDKAIPEKVILDRGRIRQVLVNLTNNSIKFTESGYIKIRSLLAGNRQSLRFEVIDTGIGISEDKKGKLFEKFSQADSSSTENTAVRDWAWHFAKSLSV